MKAGVLVPESARNTNDPELPMDLMPKLGSTAWGQISFMNPPCVPSAISIRQETTCLISDEGSQIEDQ